MAQAKMLYHHGDCRVLERDANGAKQDQGTAPRQRARVEHAPEIFGREPR
jgi:hypothetical protein